MHSTIAVLGRNRARRPKAANRSCSRGLSAIRRWQAQGLDARPAAEGLDQEFPFNGANTEGGEKHAANQHRRNKAGDETVWRDYVLSRMSDEMRAVAPMEGHLGMMRQMHRGFGQAEIVAVFETENAITLSLRDPASSETIPVTIDYAADGSVTGLLIG